MNIILSVTSELKPWQQECQKRGLYSNRNTTTLTTWKSILKIAWRSFCEVLLVSVVELAFSVQRAKNGIQNT